MNDYIVYMHISPSNKRYIGITCQDIDKRWKKGKGYKTQQYFYRAIKKYGWDNFQHIIIAKGLDEETAKWLEIELIREFDTTDRRKGYNITFGGEGTNGWIPSEETRKKISESHKGKTHTEEARKKMSKPKSEEHKIKLSEAKKGENNPNYGKHHSDEHKRKLSENHADFSGKNNPGARTVICITTGRIFFTVKEGAEYYNCFHSNVSKCCKDKYKSCGKLPDGTPLVWRYIEIIEL